MRTTLSFTAVILLTLPLSADEIRGKVVSISDGDTVTVLDANKV